MAPWHGAMHMQSIISMSSWLVCCKAEHNFGGFSLLVHRIAASAHEPTLLSVVCFSIGHVCQQHQLTVFALLWFPGVLRAVEACAGVQLLASCLGLCHKLIPGCQGLLPGHAVVQLNL